MVRSVGWVVVFSSVAVGVAGCAGSPPEPRLAAAPRGMVCDKTSSTVMQFGRATTALYAETNLKLHQADLRGDMVRGGVRRVHVVQRRTDCQPVGTGIALASVYQCTAVVQLCGR